MNGKGVRKLPGSLIDVIPEVHFSCERRRQDILMYFSEKLVKDLSCEGSSFSYSSGFRLFNMLVKAESLWILHCLYILSPLS